MTSVSYQVIRTALCGHEYVAQSPRGRRRKYGECDCKPAPPVYDYSELGRRASRARWLKVARAESCMFCGGELPPDGLSSYCSTRCRSRASYARRKDRISAERKSKREEAVRVCPQCQERFTPSRTLAQKFCSKRCSANFHRDSSGKQCSFDDCDRPLRARGMCAMHWRRWARSTGRERNPEWNERRRANYQKRRALKSAVPAADIVPDEIFERDGWRCGLCGGMIDRSARWPAPESASLDHMVPLSIGGHHVPDNVQAAHLSCNVRKGNRVSADAMSA